MNLRFVLLFQVCLGLIQLDFEKVRSARSRSDNHLLQRDGTSDLQVSSQNLLYVAQLEVGSNKDKISVLVDTFSGDTAFPVSNVYCSVSDDEDSDDSDDDYYDDFYDEDDFDFDKKRAKVLARQDGEEDGNATDNDNDNDHDGNGNEEDGNATDNDNDNDNDNDQDNDQDNDNDNDNDQDNDNGHESDGDNDNDNDNDQDNGNDHNGNGNEEDGNATDNDNDNDNDQDNDNDNDNDNGHESDGDNDNDNDNDNSNGLGKVHATTNTCTQHGSFETGKSSSWTASNKHYFFDEMDNYYVGTYGSDSIGLNGKKIDGVTFVAVNKTSAPYGFLGLGPATTNRKRNRGSKRDVDPSKNGFLDTLVSQGVIDKKLFSLYLNHASSSTGSVLFGGVDYAKINGSLTTVPMRKSSVGYQITLSGVDLVVGDQLYQMSDHSKPALLVATSPFSTVPGEVFRNIGKSLKGTMKRSSMYEIDCPADDSVKVRFDFLGATIEVPLTDLVVPSKQGNRCLLGLLPGNKAILGENFLRSAYVVFDVEDSQISLAQAKYTNDTTISTISSGIPSATSAATTAKGRSSAADATAVISYATGAKSFNSADAAFASVLENNVNDGSAKASGSATATATKSQGSGGSGSGSSNSDGNGSSSSSKGDAAPSIMSVSLVSSVFAGLLLLLA